MAEAPPKKLKGVARFQDDLAKSFSNRLELKQADTSSKAEVDPFITPDTSESNKGSLKIASNDPKRPSLPTRNIRLSDIDENVYQPRLPNSKSLSEESIDELMQSITDNAGLMQPITVRLMANGRFMLIGGARRVGAYRKLGLESIPAIVRECSDLEAATLSLVDNLEREDNTDFEMAIFAKRLSDEFSLSNEELSKILGKNRRILTMLSGYNKLPKRFLDLLHANPESLNYSNAETFVKIIGSTDKETEDLLFSVFEQSIKEKWPQVKIFSELDRRIEMQKLEGLRDSKSQTRLETLRKDTLSNEKVAPLRLSRQGEDLAMLSLSKYNVLSVKPLKYIPREDLKQLRAKIYDVINQYFEDINGKDKA